MSLLTSEQTLNAPRRLHPSTIAPNVTRRPMHWEPLKPAQRYCETFNAQHHPIRTGPSPARSPARRSATELSAGGARSKRTTGAHSEASTPGRLAANPAARKTPSPWNEVKDVKLVRYIVHAEQRGELLA